MRFFALVITALMFGAAGARVEAQAGPAPVPPPAAEAPAEPAVTPEEQAEKDRKARQLFEAGRLAYGDGYFSKAYENFRLSYELSQRHALLFNLGMAAERARLDAEALDAFEAYLRHIPNAQNANYVRGRIAFLRDKKQESEPAAPEALQPGPAAATAPDQAPGDDSGLVGKWWFWGAIGAGAALATVTVVLVASGDGEPVRGDVGGVVATLELE